MPFVLSLLLLAQVGPFAGTPDKSMEVPPEVRERRQAQQQTEAVQDAPSLSARLSECLAAVRADPQKAARSAESWLNEAKGVDRADAAHCLGTAYSQLNRLGEAYATLLKGRDAAPPGDRARRARLGAMAGNAALAEGEAQAALVALDAAGEDALAAGEDALAAGEKALAGDIQIDRARGLVQLRRIDEAAMALAEARKLAARNGQAWLFSAALARRQEKLVEAQTYIEKAAELRPTDPEVGLEAGRIAILAGREEAARRSWQSVIDAAPGSDAAELARGYLAQLAQEGTSAP